jgi:hypothetical protein
LILIPWAEKQSTIVRSRERKKEREKEECGGGCQQISPADWSGGDDHGDRRYRRYKRRKRRRRTSLRPLPLPASAKGKTTT